MMNIFNITAKEIKTVHDGYDFMGEYRWTEEDNDAGEVGIVGKLGALVWLGIIAYWFYLQKLRDDEEAEERARARVAEAERIHRERQLDPEARKAVIYKTIMKKVSLFK